MTPIPTSQQFRAVAFLRYRLFINGFRRKSEKGELVARFIGLPFIGLIVLSIVTGAFAAGAAATRHGEFQLIAGIFWAIFLLQIITSINIAPPGLSFDPESLIRFPLTFPRYLVIRLFLGLLSASTIIGTLALLAAAAGITYVRSSLALVAFAAAFALALTHMLLVRMIFAWVDRWLSTRRAREFFTFFIIVFSIAIQWANVTFNNLGGRATEAQQAAKLAAATHLYSRFEPFLHHLPPGLAGSAITHAAHAQPIASTLFLLAILLYATAFLAIFGWRMQREYRGENLSEVKNAPQTISHLRPDTIGAKVGASGVAGSTPTPNPVILSGARSAQSKHPEASHVTRSARTDSTTNSVPHSSQPDRDEWVPATNSVPHLRPGIIGPKMGHGGADLSPNPAFFSPAVLACLQKEWIYLRRNPSQFYGLLAPLAMVFIFAGRMGHFARTGMVFPAAAAYSILGVAALAYNVFGLDASGIQFYFLAPVTLRSVFIAKNLFAFAVTALQLVLLYAVLVFTSGRPPFLITLSTICWVIFAALVNVTMGNWRSIASPKKIDPARVSRKQASQLSALLALALMLGVAAIGSGVLFLSRYFHNPWLPIPILLGLAAAAAVVYITFLNRIDITALAHRETLIAELSKIE